MASSSRNPAVIDTELEKLFYDDDNLSDLDFDAESIGSSDGESVQHSHDSNSVVESDENDSHSDNYEPSNEDDFFLGKDQISRWNKEPPASSKKRKHDAITNLPGSKNEAKNAKTIEDAFGLFFDDEVIRMLVENTNIYIESKVLANFQRHYDAKLTTVNEMKAFIGLLVVAGVMRSSHLNFKELFSDEETAGDLFYITMSCQRFHFILRCLRFDDVRTQQERILNDRLAPIRDLFDNIVSKCSRYFSPSEYVTIDEQLVAFRGNCRFRQYIPSKPNRYGLKLFAMCDARNFYTVQMEVYLGTQPDGLYKVSNNPKDIVVRLIKPIDNSGRNVTTDNWYTSIPLANRLLSENRLTLVGTIRKNKREIPSVFLPHKSRAAKSTIFGFTKTTTLLSYVPKKSKAVLLLSTMHHDAAIDNETGVERKPKILTFYNMSKGGVDITHKLCATYDVGRRTRRWPMAIFFHLINTCALNAYIIYNHNNLETRLARRNFLKLLGKVLVTSYQRDRLNIASIPRKLKNRLRERLQIEPQPQPPEEVVIGTRKRCYLCPRSRNRHSRQICRICNKNVCTEHTNLICHECYV